MILDKITEKKNMIKIRVDYSIKIELIVTAAVFLVTTSLVPHVMLFRLQIE